MEFPNLGEHCTLNTCKQLDFLPFTCDACQKIYCNEHVKYENHNCAVGLSRDRKVPVCPLCNQPISLSANENPDQKVNDHIENDCKSDLAKHKRSGRCQVKGCKKRELIPVLCTSCKLNFCLRHRHESDHDCQAQASKSKSKQSAAGVKAGLAAASRHNTSNKPTARTQQQRKPQQSDLCTIGSDLNRLRNERQQNLQPTSNNIGGIQDSNLTNDEALALALQASLSNTQQQRRLNTSDEAQNVKERNIEDEDIALARAIEESERDERERQRRTGRQTNKEDKDRCILS